MLALLGIALLASSPAVKAPVIDTVLDSSSQDSSWGRDFYSSVGPGKALLIQDQSLALIGRRGKAASSPRIVFTVLAGEPKISSVRLIRRPWREGAGSQMTDGADPVGATWKRAAKDQPWQAPGALGPDDSSELQGWKADVEGSQITLSGLDAAFQLLVKGDPKAWGFRIEFQGAGRIGSADTPGAEPKFLRGEVDPPAGPSLFLASATPGWAPGQTPKKGDKAVMKVQVVNRGTQASEPASLTGWMAGASAGEVPIPALPPRGTLFLDVEVPWSGAGAPSEAEVVLSHNGPGASQSLAAYPLGLSVQGASPAVLDQLNRWVMPFSRFSFCPDGVAERFRPASGSESADIVIGRPGSLPFEVIAKAASWPLGPSVAGLGATDDTRDDRLAIAGLPLTPLGWASRFEGEPPTPASGLLGRYEAARIHKLAGVRGAQRDSWSIPVPKTLAFRLTDLSGAPLADIPVALYKGPAAPEAKPVFKGRSLGTGAFFVTPALFDPPADDLFTLQDPVTEAYTLVAGRPGATVEEAVPKWLLESEAARGPIPAVTLELRLALPQGPIDMAENLALNRSVEDSAGRFPAQLAALVDGDPATGVEVASEEEGAVWVEIDLGRDRLVGEIELDFDKDVPGSLQIQHYGTSQNPGVATTWVKDLATALHRAKGSGSSVVYRGPTRTMRFIRIAFLSGGPAKLNEVKVRTLAAAEAPSAGAPEGAARPPR